MSAAAATRAREKLLRSLEADGTGFEFVQAMRLLMRLYPDRDAIGAWADPAHEVVRLTVPPSFAFPPSEIASLRLPDSPSAGASTPTRPTQTREVPLRSKASTSQARMAVRFLGLTGPQGVLPHVYTSHAASRAREKDATFRDFLDLFNHRVLSLFYRAWERHHTTVPAERGEEDRLRSHLLDLAGLGTLGVQAKSPISTNSVAYYAGLLSVQTRPAAGLAQLISDYFAVPVAIEQFVGEWQPLRHGGQLRVGADEDDLDGRLGSAVIGDAVFDPLARVRLRLGPLTRVQFDSFLPDGASNETLRRLARLYADDQVGVEAQLVLARDEVPRAALGVAGSPALGFGTWLRTKPHPHDADDVRLTLC